MTQRISPKLLLLRVYPLNPKFNANIRSMHDA